MLINGKLLCMQSPYSIICGIALIVLGGVQIKYDSQLLCSRFNIAWLLAKGLITLPGYCISTYDRENGSCSRMSNGVFLLMFLTGIPLGIYGVVSQQDLVPAIVIVVVTAIDLLRLLVSCCSGSGSAATEDNDALLC